MIDTRTPQIDEFLRKATIALGDLPADERQSLLEEIEQIVREVTAEVEGDPELLLGPADRFVTELRVAAGYGPPIGARAAPSPTSTYDDLVALVRRWWPEARSWTGTALRELRPAWWALRGYLLAYVPAAVLDGSNPMSHSWVGVVPVPTNHPVVGTVLALIAMVASMHLGRQTRANPTTRRRIGGALATIAALVMLVSVASGVRDRQLFGDVAYADAVYPVEHVQEWPTTTLMSEEMERSFAGPTMFEILTPEGESFEADPEFVLQLWDELTGTYDPSQLRVFEPSSGAMLSFDTTAGFVSYLNEGPGLGG